jgi:hypothetical protein
MDATAHSNLISCLYPPPPRDRVPVYDQDWALFTSTDPFTIKRRLLDFYDQLYYTLESLADPARHLGHDISDGTDRDDIFGEVLKTRFIDLINNLLRAIHLVEFIAHLFKRLPHDTLVCISIQDQRCHLDLLFHHLVALRKAAQAYEDRQEIPIRWITVLARDLSHQAVLVAEWTDQLKLDLAHLDRPVSPVSSTDLDWSVSTDQDLSPTVVDNHVDTEPIVKRTRSHTS